TEFGSDQEIYESLLVTLMALTYGHDTLPECRKTKMPFGKLPVDIGTCTGRLSIQAFGDDNDRLEWYYREILVQTALEIIREYQNHGCLIDVNNFLSEEGEHPETLDRRKRSSVYFVEDLLNSIAQPVISWDTLKSWSHDRSMWNPEIFIPRPFDGWWYQVTTGHDRAKFRKLIAEKFFAKLGEVSQSYDAELHMLLHEGDENLLERHGNMGDADFFVSTGDEYFGVVLFSRHAAWNEASPIHGIRSVWVNEKACNMKAEWQKGMQISGLCIK
ncbi:MAG: hypothetical protein RI996_516, partial [Candidatus Parcubacteria bacterium]